MPKQSSYSTKGAPVVGDKVLVTDSEDTNQPKQVAFSTLPISTPQQTALNLKAPLASPALTGTATAVNLNISGALQVPAVSGDVSFDSDTLKVDSASNRIGVGIATPDGKAHVHSGSAGVVTANGDADDLVVENSDNGGISILTPTNKIGNIYFGDGDANIRGAILYNHPSDYMQINTAAAERLRIDSVGDVLPGITETQDLGSASLEWDNLYVQNSPTVSDERRKNSIVAIEYAADLLKSLEPVQFKYNDTVIPAELYEEGEVITEGKEAVLDEEGEIIEPAVEEVLAQGGEEKTPEKVITHSRPHTGFVAQQVKEAMTAAGLEDWAGYAYDEKADLHSLRLNEFIGVLVAGYKELDARISALEAK